MSTSVDQRREDYTRWGEFGAVPWTVSCPEKFAARFNLVVPGAYRAVTGDDMREMARCGLIGRHGFYGQADLEIVRGILLYEQMREKRSRKLSKACARRQGPAERELECVRA